ncbi:hypothetical protein D3C80_1988720 [compost metagenome]
MRLWQHVFIARPDANKCHIGLLLANILQQHLANANVQPDIHRRMMTVEFPQLFGEVNRVDG